MLVNKTGRYMTIKSELHNKDYMVLFISGRLDTTSASAFEVEVNRLIDGTIDVILDLKGLSYISSLGLHVLLQIQKLMNTNNRKLVIKNIGEAVREVFEMTGFINLITQEE